MRQERSMEYDTMIANIQYYIKAKKDFFIGGRGVGIECHCMAVGWKVEIERACFTAYPDCLEVKGDRLIMDRYGKPIIGEFDLRHYLKVQAI